MGDGSAGVPADADARATATLVYGCGSHDGACRHLAGVDSGTHRVRVRAAATSGTTSASTDTHYDTGVYEGLTLPDAGVAVADTVANLDSAASGGLRVCVDGLPQPATAAERRELFQFLHAVTRCTDAADARCHVHLGVEADADVVAVVAPLFGRVVDAAALPEP